MSSKSDCPREADARPGASVPAQEVGRFHGIPAAEVRSAGATIGETQHASGEVIDEHAHPAATLCFVIAGSFVESSDAGSWPCRPLDLLVRPPRYLHRDHVGVAGARCLNISLGPARAGEVRPLAGSGPVRSEPLSALRLYIAYRTGRSTVEPAMALFRRLQAHSFREEPAPMPPPWLREARLRLEQSATRLSIRDLGRDLGCHPVTLARRFRQCWGMAPDAFARQSRCRRAVLAVIREETPLPVIAQRFGFVDQAHLSRNVTNLVGVPPGRLRALMQ